MSNELSVGDKWMPEKSPELWGIAEWMIVCGFALVSGVARYLRDLSRGEPFAWMALASRSSGAVVGGMLLALGAVGYGLNASYIHALAGVGGAIGLQIVDLALEEVRGRFKK